ncbi:hypothetical protein D3C87_1481290 [compost metagenome]
MSDDCRHQYAHDINVVDIHAFKVRVEAESASHCKYVGLGIVFGWRRPAFDDLAHGINSASVCGLALVLVGNQHAGDGADTPARACELDEVGVGLSRRHALPTHAFSVADIAGVEVADAARVFGSHGRLL